MPKMERPKLTNTNEPSLPSRAEHISDAPDLALAPPSSEPKRRSGNITIDKDDPALESIWPKIEPLILEAVQWSADRIPLPNVEIFVRVNRAVVIPETGVGGYAPSAHRAELTVNPENLHFFEKMSLEVGATLVHELHHCSRWSGPGYGKTLLEALVSEGLAQHFETEFRFQHSQANTADEAAPFYAKALSKDALVELTARAREQFDNPNYSIEDHCNWFFGSEEQNIRRHAGYAIGFGLVGTFLTQHKGTHTAATLAHAPATTFYCEGNNSS